MGVSHLSNRKEKPLIFFYSPADLPSLFTFLGTDAIPIPNWLNPMSGQVRRRPAELGSPGSLSQWTKEQGGPQEPLTECYFGRILWNGYG